MDVGPLEDPFVVEVRALDDPDAARLIAEVQAEYGVLYGRPDIAVIEAGEFTPPGGLFLVGSLDGRAVATAAWRRRDDRDAEIKRMYVMPGARGRGLSRVMLAETERSAAAAGVSRLMLSTGVRQPAAIALYESCGYRPCEPFGAYAEYAEARFFAKALSRG